MVLPLLPSLLSMVPMLVLADMLPTLLELSMLPSVRLSLKLMLKHFTILMEDMVLDTVPILLDMVMGMVIMLDLATLLLAMVMDILGTMESVRLKLSQKLMLFMEPMGMVMDSDTVHTPLDTADTLAMDTDLDMDMDMGMDMDTMVEQSGIKSAEPWKNN